MWVIISRCCNVTASVVASLQGRIFQWVLHLRSPANSLHGWPGVVWGWKRVCRESKIVKFFLLLTRRQKKQQQRHERARGQPLPKHIDLFPHPGCVLCAAKTCSFWLPPALKRLVRLESTASPPEGEGKTDVVARVAACVLVVIAREPVNHTIPAQMPLRQQLPATAIKCRWYRWPNSSLPFYRLSALRAQIMSYIGRHWIPACNLFQRHVLIRAVTQS